MAQRRSFGASTCSRHCDTDAGSVNDQAWPAAGCCGDMNWCTSSLCCSRCGEKTGGLTASPALCDSSDVVEICRPSSICGSASQVGF